MWGLMILTLPLASSATSAITQMSLQTTRHSNKAGNMLVKNISCLTSYVICRLQEKILVLTAIVCVAHSAQHSLKYSVKAPLSESELYIDSWARWVPYAKAKWYLKDHPSHAFHFNWGQSEKVICTESHKELKRKRNGGNQTPETMFICKRWEEK